MLRSVLQREMCDIRRNDLRPNLSPTFATLSPVVINEEIGHTTWGRHERHTCANSMTISGMWQCYNVLFPFISMMSTLQKSDVGGPSWSVDPLLSEGLCCISVMLGSIIFVLFRVIWTCHWCFTDLAQHAKWLMWSGVQKLIGQANLFSACIRATPLNGVLADWIWSSSKPWWLLFRQGVRRYGWKTNENLKTMNHV